MFILLPKNPNTFDPIGWNRGSSMLLCPGCGAHFKLDDAPIICAGCRSVVHYDCTCPEAELLRSGDHTIYGRCCDGSD